MKNENKIKNKVEEWNDRFPIDFWWRKKHGIAFMSPEHKAISFLSQLFEYEEERMIENIKNEIKNPYIPNSGDFWKKSEECELSEDEQLRNAKSEFEEYQKQIGNG